MYCRQKDSVGFYTHLHNPSISLLVLHTPHCLSRYHDNGFYHRSIESVYHPHNNICLFAAAVIMVIAVCIVVSVFIWLLKENAELQKLKQSVTETVQSAENKQLQETLEKIQSQATEISDNLNDYSWIGSEDEGKISYLRQKDDGSWQVMKILIYPSLSQDGYYQEYYYWNNVLLFAHM